MWTIVVLSRENTSKCNTTTTHDVLLSYIEFASPRVTTRKLEVITLQKKLITYIFLKLLDTYKYRPCGCLYPRGMPAYTRSRLTLTFDMSVFVPLVVKPSGKPFSWSVWSTKHPSTRISLSWVLVVRSPIRSCGGTCATCIEAIFCKTVSLARSIDPTPRGL